MSKGEIHPHGSLGKKGRPPLPQGQARTARVVVFLTPSELARLSKLARAKRDSLSSTGRRFLLAGLAAAEVQSGAPCSK